MSEQDEITQGVNPWLIAVAVMLATFMEVLDTAIASVALPYIAGSLSASNDEATWVLTSYLVANAVILPTSNWCSLRFGRKRFLLTCVVIFTISSFFCGVAPSLICLLLARIAQGAGGGALQPLSQAILLESFPIAKRSQAQAFYVFGVVVAPVIGPTLGGWLTDSYSWRYAFYINIPIGILAFFMIKRFVHDPAYIRDAKPGPFDNIGFGLLAVWTGALQVLLDRGQEDDWMGAVWLRWALFFCVSGFALFLVHCLRAKHPLVELRIFHDRNFAVGCILIFLFGISLYSLVTVLPLFYQELLGYTAFAAGVAVAPRGLGTILGIPAIGFLGGKLDARYLLTFGFLLYGLTTLYFGNLTLAVGPWTFTLPLMITGFALSFIFVPITTAAYGTLPRSAIGNASGIFNLLRNVGGSVGISAAQTMLVRRADFHQNQILNYVPQSGAEFQQRLGAVQGFLGRQTNPANASGAAAGTLYQQLGAQALTWAFVDIFRWSALVCFLSVAAVWLFRKVSKKPPAGAH